MSTATTGATGSPAADRLRRPVRRTGRILLSTAVIAGPLAACGGGGSSASPQRQIRSAFSQIKSAIATSDARRLCSLISTGAQRELISEVSRVLPSDTCAAAAERFLQLGGSQLRAQLGNATLTAVRVTGPGTATTTDTTGATPSHWLEQGGSWKLATDGGT